MKLSKLLVIMTILTLFISTTYANDSLDALSEQMSSKAMDFHAMLDESLEYEPHDFKVIQARKDSILVERPNDKDLAKIVIIINRAPKGTAKDAQRAKVYIDGRLEREFVVSTGAIGYDTRTGYFRPVYTNHFRFYNEYYSGKYGSRMARAIFFSGGYAIHHTDAVRKLGTRASHGCVRFNIEAIDWINKTAMELLGNENPRMVSWNYAHHASWKKNSHYIGLNRKDINPINRYTGKVDYTKEIPSLDMIIIVKDEMDSDK